jgi:hypothetical protein
MCAATPSGEAYWAGGHTIGFIQCAAYLAAKSITSSNLELQALATKGIDSDDLARDLNSQEPVRNTL